MVLLNASHIFNIHIGKNQPLMDLRLLRQMLELHSTERASHQQAISTHCVHLVYTLCVLCPKVKDETGKSKESVTFVYTFKRDRKSGGRSTCSVALCIYPF
ncbi:hypothetical protein J6590_070542 [Homalodisca vitripennis]|nr:hypothetical protein J6590_070542 [Homalodisca vitripennis]